MSAADERQQGRTLLLAGLVALAYYATGRFGLGIYIAEGTATLVWPPTGIAIAAVLLFGNRIAPGIAVGAFLVNLAIGLPVAAALAIAAGNTAEALAARSLLLRLGVAQNPFDGVRQNLRYVVAVVLATSVSAIVGATTSVVAGIRPLSMLDDLWLQWWMGDLAGALLLGPVLYLAGRRWLERHRPDRRIRWGKTGRNAEYGVVLLLATGLAYAVQAAWLSPSLAAGFTWLPVLLLLWSARRFSALATIGMSFVIACATVAGVLEAGSLADKATVADRLLLLYVFLFVQSLVALLASAFVYERRQLIRELDAARLAAQRASEQKSRFLANISHEIRTPLNGIIGMSNLLRDEITDAAHRERLRIIESSAGSLLNILNDVIDHARIEAGGLRIARRAFALPELLQDVAGLFEPQAAIKGIALRLRIDGDVPGNVIGDDTRIRQVLVNLLSNAVKFTEKGSVELQVAAGEQVPLLLFTVRDTGIGIPVNAIDRVLEPFAQADESTTRRFGGSGLGLTISRQLVEAMGGTLSLSSADGLGTVIQVRLPLPRAAEGQRVAHVVAGELPADGSPVPRVLLVEDNDVDALVAQRLLESLGCRVTRAIDGEQAVSLAQEGFDLVLMDCHMPRCDGYDATRAIRAAETGDTHMAVVGLTGNHLPDERDRCLAAGMDDYLAKPVTADDLRYVIARHVAARDAV